VLDRGPILDLGDFVGGYTAKKEVGNIFLEHDNLAVVAENALEHVNCALKNGYNTQHGGDAKGNASDPDQRADTMAEKIGKDQSKDSH
jgi:hypothetical protein